MQRESQRARGPDTSAVQLLYETCVYTAYKCANRAGAPQRRKPVAWRLVRQGWRPRETEGQTLSHLSVVVVAHLRIIEVRYFSLLRHERAPRASGEGSHSTQGFFPRPRDSPAAAPAAGPATLCSTLACTSPTCPARRFYTTCEPTSLLVSVAFAKPIAHHGGRRSGREDGQDGALGDGASHAGFARSESLGAPT
jgi:hypothetical protein